MDNFQNSTKVPSDKIVTRDTGDFPNSRSVIHFCDFKEITSGRKNVQGKLLRVSTYVNKEDNRDSEIKMIQRVIYRISDMKTRIRNGKEYQLRPSFYRG